MYNVGAGRCTSLNQLWETLARAVRALHPHAEILPRIRGEAREGDVRHSQADITRIRAELGYQPAPERDAALRETVAWYAHRIRREAPAAVAS
ncbi:MAG TPA: hypothetical protein VGB96_08260 [Archangium sp.]